MAPPREGGDQAPAPERGGHRASPRRRLWVSRSPGKVVARYLDGRLLKGYTDFDPDLLGFRLVPAEDPESEEAEIRVADLKAVFFVRSFAGNPEYVESKDLYQTRPPGTRKVRVEFVDGEELVGHTRDDPAKRPGFFFSPFDPQSNNLRVFAVFDAVRRVERRL